MKKMIKDAVMMLAITIGMSTPCVAHEGFEFAGFVNGEPMTYREYHDLLNKSDGGRQSLRYCKAKGQLAGDTMYDRLNKAPEVMLAELKTRRHQMPTFAYIDLQRTIRDATRKNKMGNWVHNETPEDFAHNEYDNCIFTGF